MSLSSHVQQANSGVYRSAFYKVERLWGLLLCTPYMIGLVVFAVGPILFSLMLGFFEWNSIGTPKFVGLQNWERLLSDELFRKALFNTLFFVIGTVPTGVFFSLVLAVLLVAPKRLQTFFRSVYFLPVVTSNVAIALVWSWFYDSNYGVLNYVIESSFKFVGVSPPDPVAWLNDPRTALPAIMIMTVWKGLGYNMVIFLAALQGVPKSLYEAAEIDGANVVQKFFSITVPSIAPVIFLLL
ncbi:MAG: carbohydrate ABC transporter permease [Sumerlaeia bacterium]